jgi:predicted dehydrogenase
VIGAAIVGSGTYARVHARALKNDPRVELRWVWSRNPANRERFAREFDIRAADDWRRVIEDSHVDAVHVVTPDFAHTDYVIAALSAGKHVLVEKPMATSSEECRRILRARDESGKKLMVNFHNRWYPAFQKAAEVVAAGEIGTVTCGSFVLSDTITWTENNMRWAEKSGPEWFLMPHLADLACWILKDVPSVVFAMAREGLLLSKGLKTRDMVRAMVRMKGGAIVNLESSWIVPAGWRNPVNEMWISVQGEHGRIDVNADYENVTVATEKFRTPFTLLSLTEDPPIHEFVTCVVENKPVPVTGEDGLLATRLVEAVVQSFTEKRPVAMA